MALSITKLYILYNRLQGEEKVTKHKDIQGQQLDANQYAIQLAGQ